MKTNTSAEEKRTAVEHLNFGAKTAKRVGWEAWEFAVAGPYQIEVTNAAYGFEKDDHSYIVGIEDQDGVPVPAECGCKADQYREDYDCKHKVALATVGGSLVLEAAVDAPTPSVDTGETTSKTLEERLRTDGGTVIEQSVRESPPLDAKEHGCANGEEWCQGPAGDELPCLACYELTEGQ